MSPRKCLYCCILMPRGSYAAATHGDGSLEGHYCRSELKCFNRILMQRNALLRIGNQMANTFFNASQRTAELSCGDNEIFKDLQERWDAEKRGCGL